MGVPVVLKVKLQARQVYEALHQPLVSLAPLSVKAQKYLRTAGVGAPLRVGNPHTSSGASQPPTPTNVARDLLQSAISAWYPTTN